MIRRRLISTMAIALALHALSFAESKFVPDIEKAKEDARQSADVSKEEACFFSSSKIDWNKQTFVSQVSLDLVKAGIPMPSGKSSAANRITMELPLLIKDPLLSVYIDDTRTIGDLVLNGTITLDQLTRIIDSSKQTPASFKNGGNELQTQHTLKLQEIGSLLVKHKKPYTQQKPIERISSRAYSGIIIDARGILPVHGDFVQSSVQPCLFPQIWDENMILVYERNMVDPSIAKTQGIISYTTDKNEKSLKNRVGDDPLWITAQEVFGVYRCDPVISHDDYLRITTIPENLKLLEQGKVVILLGSEQIAHSVSAPEKNVTYYTELQRLRYEFDDVVPNTVVKEGTGWIQITVQDLLFKADSAQLLPDEVNRIGIIAQQIKEAVSNGDFTILVEGHTADVNKPNGQLNLSIERAQAIVNALESNGISKSIMTYKGYGGTQPIQDNSTPEGRAANRRVEIKIMPRESFEQRR